MLALLGPAIPAAADPPGPTSYTAEVVGMDPVVDGIEVEVLGGDAFLQLRNDGHQVVVPGYDGVEQYLRFDPDGTVSVNLRSSSHWQNQDRYLVGVEAPTDVGPDQPPRWEPVSSDGTYAWHDHRIHWMSPQSLPPAVDPAVGEPQDANFWVEPIPVEVDGQPVAIQGRLTWLPDASPAPTILGVVLGLLLVAIAAAVRGTRTAILTGVGVGLVVTGVVGLAGSVGLPPGVQAEPLPLILTALAAVVAGAGLSVSGRTSAAGVVAGAAGIPLVVWALTNLGAVTAPVVPPTVVPGVLVRTAIGLSAGLGVATVVAGIRDLFTQPFDTGSSVDSADATRDGLPHTT